MIYHADYLRKMVSDLDDIDRFLKRMTQKAKSERLTPSERYKILQRFTFSSLLSKMADVVEAAEKLEREECGITEDDLDERILHFCEEFVPRTMVLSREDRVRPISRPTE